MSAYMLWLNSAREEIKSQHPGLKVTEIAKKGGEMWRAMKDKTVGSEIAIWEDKAAKAKEQYTKDLEAFNANGGGGEPKKAQKRGKKAPAKKPVTKSKKKKDESEDEESEEEEESE